MGDCVTVRIPRIDWASTDPNRLLCIIVQVIGTACAMYRLRCKSGVLNKCYSACDLEFLEGNFCLSVNGWESSTRVYFEQLQKKVCHGVHFQRIGASAQQAAAHNDALARRIKLNSPHTAIKGITAKTIIVHLNQL